MYLVRIFSEKNKSERGEEKTPFLWLPNMQCTDYFEQKLLASTLCFATKQSVVVVSKSTPLEKCYCKGRVARGKKLPKILFKAIVIMPTNKLCNAKVSVAKFHFRAYFLCIRYYISATYWKFDVQLPFL